MAKVIRKQPTTVIADDPVVEETAVVTERPVEARPVAVAPVEPRIIQIVYLVLSIIEISLALRLVLRLLGANSTNAFVSLIYALTYPLIVPFTGIFALPVNLGVASFEVATIMAMIIYAIVAYLIVAAVRVSLTRDRV